MTPFSLSCLLMNCWFLTTSIVHLFRCPRHTQHLRFETSFRPEDHTDYTVKSSCAHSHRITTQTSAILLQYKSQRRPKYICMLRIMSFSTVVKDSTPFGMPYVTSTYAKVSVDVLQRKEAEESACGKLHDPAFKITEIYFQEKFLRKFLVKNGNYWSFRLKLILEMSMHNFVEISWSNEEVFDAKRISYSELGFASRILHQKFMLPGLWCNILMLQGC